MLMTDELLFSLVFDSIKAALTGSRWLRVTFFTASAVLFLGIGLLIAGASLAWAEPWKQGVPVGLMAVSSLTILGIGAYRRAVASTARERVIREVEERARQSPDEPQAAWDLARLTLESYLSRNLRQVQWIFGLTVLVMLAGFGIIAYGIAQVYRSPETLKPSIVVTTSGILVEFIAATLLFVYRSTMEQARSYVGMLEKINAVGMSIQILDKMKSGDTDKFRARLAMRLLSLYGTGGEGRRGRDAVARRGTRSEARR